MSYTVTVYAQQTLQEVSESPEPLTAEAVEGGGYPFGTACMKCEGVQLLGELTPVYEPMCPAAVEDCFNRDDGMAANEGTHDFCFSVFVTNDNSGDVVWSTWFRRNITVVVPTPYTKWD